MRQNKKTWFLILSLLSLVAIGIILFSILTLSDSVSQKIYVNTAKKNHFQIDNVEKIKFEKQAIIIKVLSTNQTILNAFEKKDSQQLDTSMIEINQMFKIISPNNLRLSLYPNNIKEENHRKSITLSLKTKEISQGYEQINDEVFSITLLPIIQDEEVMGIIELKEPLTSDKTIFEQLNYKYAFFLKNISKNTKDKSFTQLNDSFGMKHTNFISQVLNTSSRNLKNESTPTEGYFLNNEYLINYHLIEDINGEDLGYIAVSEHINFKDSLTSIVKSMVNQIIIMVMGLITAIILFMF